MQFNSVYGGTGDNYYADPGGYFGEFQDAMQQPQIEGQITVADMGASVPEGRQFGNFVQTATNMIRQGASKLELSTNMGGGPEAVGAEAYGKEARQALRELSKVNQVPIISIHTPANIGNLSGYNPQERGFNDELRKQEIDEVKKAIEFAADTGGGAVVVHTGEYPRDMSNQKWARTPDGKRLFLSYDEEIGRANVPLVDERDGKLVMEVKKSKVIREPEFKMKYDPVQKRMRYVDIEGNFLDDTNPEDLFRRVPKWDEKLTRFKTRRIAWDDFVKRADEWNKFYPKGNGSKWTPEELFLRSQLETRMLQARGSSLYYAQRYEDERKAREQLVEALKVAEQIEKKVPKEEQWKLMQQVLPSSYAAQLSQRYLKPESKLPSEVIRESIRNIDMQMKHIHEASSAADAQADEIFETMEHVVPVEEYAKKQTSRSYAEAAIHAMEMSHNNKNVEREIFIAPENIFPEMGYGSHPEELIELVKNARQKMVEYLTEPYIDDPHGRLDPKTGRPIKVPNPNYRKMSKQEAMKEAETHIKATLDTQHLGMWWKHFQPLPGESYEERKKRFDKWYMEQIKKMEKENIIGHIHVVDAIGGGHQHLPLGQGNLPVKEALEYLKKKGYKGTMISEAYGENAMFGAGRQLTQTWKALGVPLQSAYVGAPQRWTEVHNSYFGRARAPYFIFGAYAPSNDWQLWSQVPME